MLVPNGGEASSLEEEEEGGVAMGGQGAARIGGLGENPGRIVEERGVQRERQGSGVG